MVNNPAGLLLSELSRKTSPGILPAVEALDRNKAALFNYLKSRLNSPFAAKALTVKILNLCAARYHFQARSTTLISQPYGLEVDPINNCNLACPGCVHSTHSRNLQLFEWNSGMLTPERFAAFLDIYGPAAIQLTLCNYGEPTLNPKTPDFIRLAKNYLLFTTLSTNMTAKRFDAEAYAASGLDFMTVSLDGATQPVYEKFRRKGDLDLAFANVAALVEAKKKLGKTRPLISWQFLAFEHNTHEIDDAIRIARTLGIDQFTVATPFDVSWDDPAIQPAAISPVTHVFRTDTEKTLAANWNPFSGEPAFAAVEREFETDWLNRLAAAPPDVHRDNSHSCHVCHWLYKNMVMDATGRIIPCCAAPQPGKDLVFGSFEGVNTDLFNSEKYRLARLSLADKPAYAAARASNPPRPRPPLPQLRLVQRSASRPNRRRPGPKLPQSRRPQPIRRPHHLRPEHLVNAAELAALCPRSVAS